MLQQDWEVFPKNKEVEEALKSLLLQIIETTPKMKSPHTGDPNEKSPGPNWKVKLCGGVKLYRGESLRQDKPHQQRRLMLISERDPG